jgi:hypothetical protein
MTDCRLWRGSEIDPLVFDERGQATLTVSKRLEYFPTDFLLALYNGLVMVVRSAGSLQARDTDTPIFGEP